MSLELLTHHVERDKIILRHCFGEHSPTDDEIRLLVKETFVPVVTRKLTETTHEFMYPNLKTSQGVEQYIEARTKRLIAVRDNNYARISDLNPLTGTSNNTDWFCRNSGCTNVDNNMCVEQDRALGIR